jgi:hypothetical protein
MGRPERLLAVSLVALAIAAAAPRGARAQAQRVVVDQVTLEPSPLYGQARLRVFVSATELSGNVIPISGPKAWTLKLGNADKRVPFYVTTFDGGNHLLAVAIVVETTAEYGPDLPVIQKVLGEELLAKLSPGAQAAVIGYADKAGGAGKFAPGKTAASKLAGLVAATEPTEPALVDAVERALGAMKKLKTDPEGQPIRKLVIVVSDGRDKVDDRPRITALGKRAAKAGIRIHSLAYSPTDTRKPLLLLGELSKQSGGTFRWVHKIGAAPIEQSFKDQVENLRAEIDRQYVITAYLPADEVAGKKLGVEIDLQGKKIESIDGIKVPQLACGAATCAGDGYCVNRACVARGDGGARGVLGWVLLVGGIGVGAIVVLGFIGFLLQRRQQRDVALPLGAAPPGSVPPGGVPAGAYDPNQIQGVPRPSFAPAAPAAPAPVQRIMGVGEGQTTAQPHGHAGAAQPVLYVMAGPRGGQRLPLRHGFLIGKDPRCDLPLPDDGFASSHHAMILMDARGNCTLQDRGSTNGTFVNGVRVGEMALTHGMQIRIGSTDLRFLVQ